MTLMVQDLAAGRKNAQIGTELVLETDAMRVWHLRLAPGETIPPHRYDRPYVWTILTDGYGVSRFDDGRVVEIAYKAGDTKNFPDLTPETGFIHDLTNTGETELVFVTVEFNTEGTKQ
ncbi:cupin domain-containing protein [uncultured Roseobacter sp.]|uniref:cupin domain-containing protein n=1 Tax=uncultured Roseobacter sp. TaxID=114847 RepID=UPI002630AF0A|nr:cupin domain-containing protein [uncultured Roseobacter sp.]